MAYQLKTIGIAANCVMCMAVDPDTGTLKDFASSAVTADMTVPAGVTFGTADWDGNTRNYFKAASGAVPTFGTTKPAIRLNGTTDTALTLVAILRAPAADIPRYVIFGPSASHHFCAYQLSAGGSTHPSIYGSSSERHGTSAIPTAGTKRIFGFSLDRAAASYNWYTATDIATSMTTGTIASPGGLTMDLSVLCGITGVTTSVNVSDFFAILAFNTALTEAQWDSLRDDWRGVLIESAGGGAVDATVTGGTGTSVGSGSGGDATGVVAGDATASGGTGTGVGSGSGGDATGAGAGTFVSSEIWSSGLLQVGSAALCTWYPGSIGADPTSALVHRSLVTSASGQLTLTGLPSGVGAMLALLPDGKFYYEPGSVS